MSRLLASLRTLRLRALAPNTIIKSNLTYEHTRPASTFTPGPSPPKLPSDQQAEFERLQRSAAVSSAFQDPTPTTSEQAPPSTSQPRHTTSPTANAANAAATTTDTASATSEDKEDEAKRFALFKGAPPEFKGDTNPKTGEVGGPKNEPLRWGGQGEWSYNGRATDF